jgi:hypothetical protein
MVSLIVRNARSRNVAAVLPWVAERDAVALVAEWFVDGALGEDLMVEVVHASSLEAAPTPADPSPRSP